MLNFHLQVLARPPCGLDLFQNAFNVDPDGRFRETKPIGNHFVGVALDPGRFCFWTTPDADG